MQNNSLLGRNYFEENQNWVLNDWTKYASNLGQLIEVVDHSITETGRTHLIHSLNNPSISLEKINAKHEALDELRINSALRQSIVDVLERFTSYEKKAIEFYSTAGGSSLLQTYSGLPSARELVLELPKWAFDIPEPESPYLRQLKHDITSLNDSPAHKLAKGPIFNKLFKKEVLGLDEIDRNNWKVFPIPYYNSFAKAGWVLGSGFIVGELGALLYPAFFSLGFVVGGLAGHRIGINRDKKKFHGPIARRLFVEPQSAYTAVGALDELISFNEFDKEMRYSVLPKMSDDLKDFFEVKSLINPVLYKGIKADSDKSYSWDLDPIRNYVPNDVFLGNGTSLKFLTGPNMSGKKSVAKAIIYARILAQAGCYVPAKCASMNIAHQIHYLVGHKNTETDMDNGLEMQFLQAKELLFNGNSRTFMIIDDLVEDTTVSEKLEHVKNQLYGFVHKGIDLLYMTHDYQLAQQFQKRNIGSFSQIEFNGDKSTYILVPGISKNSRSDIIAKKSGFDKDAIKEHLVDMGYIKPRQRIDDFRRSKNH